MPLCTLLYESLHRCDFCHLSGGKNTRIMLVFIYSMKMEAESLSETFISTYGSNDLENQSTKT